MGQPIATYHDNNTPKPLHTYTNNDRESALIDQVTLDTQHSKHSASIYGPNLFHFPRRWPHQRFDPLEIRGHARVHAGQRGAARDAKGDDTDDGGRTAAGVDQLQRSARVALACVAHSARGVRTDVALVEAGGEAAVRPRRVAGELFVAGGEIDGGQVGFQQDRRAGVVCGIPVGGERSMVSGNNGGTCDSAMIHIHVQYHMSC